MKLNTAPANAVEMQGVTHTSSFSIQASAKAFDILSDGLYSNKILAIVRELSTNALDSHVAAGKADVPFQVTLPNQMYPYFAIRDYGTGLDHDEVVNIYTTYFNSTKTDSDDFVGALGLGSKSPFSYTDNFTVTAIKNGVRRIYSAFINDSGIPSVALMSEEETDECNGVEVRFSVTDSGDCYLFAAEAAKVYRFFEVRPEIQGAPVEIQDYEYLYRDIIPNVHIQKENMQGSVVVMGSIGYRVDLNQLRLEYSERNFFQVLPIEMHVPIGAVEFTASREELSYTDRTIETVSNLLRQTREELLRRIDSDLAAIDNYWDQIQYAAEKSGSYEFRDLLAKSPTLKNNPLFEKYTLGSIRIEEKDLAQFNIKGVAVSMDYSNWATKRAPSKGSRLLGYRNRHADQDPIRGWEFNDLRNLRFVNGTGEKRATLRLQHYAHSHRKQDFFLVLPLDKKQPVDFGGFMKFLYDVPAQNQMDFADIPDIVEPKKPREQSTVSFLVRKSSTSQNMVVRQTSYTMEEAERGRSDDKGPIVYVTQRGTELRVGDKAVDARKIADVLRVCRSAGSIAVLKPEQAKVAGRSKKWIRLDTYIQKLFGKSNEEKIKASVTHGLTSAWEELLSIKEFQNGVNDSDIVELARIHQENRYGFDGLSFDNVRKLVSLMSMEKEQKQLDQIKESVYTVLDKYPMVGLVTNYRAQMNYKTIVEYINEKGK